MTYEACGSNVLIRINRQTDEELLSGIIVPAGSEPQAIGEVISVGPNVYEMIQPGAMVLFQPFRAVESWREGEDTVVVLRDDDVFAVITAEVGIDMAKGDATAQVVVGA